MTLRAAVIGVGAMGRHHARVYHELPETRLVGVADPNPEHTGFVAQRYGAPTFADHRALLDATRPDLVSVAVPTRWHLPVASDVIGAGCGVLVEKPLASDLVEAQTLIRRAEAAGVVLTVGHIERFNPAVQELRARLKGDALGTVFEVRAHRTGPFPERVRDVGVVIDLATHDLDIMRWLLECEAVRIQAETAQRIHTDHEDLVAAVLRFENDAIGMLDINWLMPTKVRALAVLGERGMFRVDYITQDLYFYENIAADRHWERYGELHTVGEGNMTRLAIDRREPLAAELTEFAHAVRDGRAPVVTGADGLAALRLARAVVRAGKSGRPVDPRSEPPPDDTPSANPPDERGVREPTGLPAPGVTGPTGASIT